MVKNNQGFSLIELMIVMAVLGVLVAIAIPNYNSYVIKAKRADMMAEMQSIAMRIENRRLVEGNYTNIDLTKVMGGTLVAGFREYPSVGAVYDVSLWDMSVSPETRIAGAKLTGARWKIRAVPKVGTVMADDGVLTLDYTQQKCRNQTGSEKCGRNDEWKN